MPAEGRAEGSAEGRTMSVVLACDLGGSSFRAALIDRRGATLAQSTVAAPAGHDGLAADGAAVSEIAPSAWWSALVAAGAELARSEPALFAQVEAVAICGVTRTQVFLDRTGTPLRPAITWKDTRAAGAAARLKSVIDALHPEQAALNAFHPLARLAWLREAEPAAFAALGCVLEPKDYLNFRLTGRRASDPVSLARLLACTDSVGGIDPLAALGASRAILPRLLEPCDDVGPILAGLPAPFDGLAGVPVFCASNDTWTAVVGLGAMRPGFAYNISGTTEVLGLVGTEPAHAQGLMTVDWRGLYQLGGPGQNGADTVSWLLALLGQGADATAPAIDALLAGPRHPQPLLFLPYLQGERVPYWDADLRGAFVGLQRRHGPTDLAWAVLEGVAFLNRIVIERAEAAASIRVGEIRFGGGAARNAAWCRVKADICGRPIVVGRNREPGLLGAAIVAWTGLRVFASLAEAQDELVAVAARYEPDPARTAIYDGLFALYRQAEAALAPLSHGLAALSGAQLAQAAEAAAS